jgi:hypothetical protein
MGKGGIYDGGTSKAKVFSANDNYKGHQGDEGHEMHRNDHVGNDAHWQREGNGEGRHGAASFHVEEGGVGIVAGPDGTGVRNNHSGKHVQAPPPGQASRKGSAPMMNANYISKVHSKNLNNK